MVFDENNVIQRLLLKPFIQFPETDERHTKNTYTMPIKDKWFVFWGGTNEFLNYHYLYENQRYAYDLVCVHNGLTFKNTPQKNENFFAFNKEVVAPFQGRIVKVINDVIDNVPGDVNENEPLGNYLVIEHENNEYSLIAHFKRLSIDVKEGDTVETGQKLGLCGNSGNSTEPHIHFQVMDAKNILFSTSINIKFENDSPIQGDYVYPIGYSAEHENKKIDGADKADIASSLTDMFSSIYKVIGSLFK
ncbi:M23 family metallopeptidase [Exiguobacterium sp. S3]|uniref:M23 family metallopeptidase n=1 Tax=Exiguobacterium sp. S3 TaxID=483245 RepID=UPI00333A28D9